MKKAEEELKKHVNTLHGVKPVLNDINKAALENQSSNAKKKFAKDLEA